MAASFGWFGCCHASQRNAPTLVQLCNQYFSRHFSKSKSILRKKTVSSHEWLRRQLSDPYVQQARVDKWRCRSAYKLLEIDDKHQLLLPGSTVIDCGAAPGSWSQVATRRVHQGTRSAGGTVVSIDLQQMEPIDGAILLDKSDFTSETTQDNILRVLHGRQADVVLSDMAPNASGNRHLDHDIIFNLCLSVLRFSSQVLSPGGAVVCKIWMGSEQTKLESVMKRMFRHVIPVKPKASRNDSAELFLVGKDYFLIGNKPSCKQ